VKGFAVGSLGLIVLYVVLQRGSANNIEGAGSLVVAFLKRATSPEVAGVPRRRTDLGPRGGSYGSDPAPQPSRPQPSPGVPVYQV
jgi:hypothetical protein